MTWIKTGSTTVSAVSSVSIDNCFSITYNHYILMAKCVGSTTTNLLVRLRAGGSDATASNYDRVYWNASGTGTSTLSSTNSSFVPGFGELSSVEYGFHLLRIGHPFTANYTSGLNWLGNRIGGNIDHQHTYYIHNVASSYDGITAYVGTGNFTGTITVYGLRES